jgi:hypothetical protein
VTPADPLTDQVRKESPPMQAGFPYFGSVASHFNTARESSMR